MIRGDTDFLNTIAEIQIAGNRLWRILALFGIILAAFIIGRIARFFLQKSAAGFDRRGQQIAATTLTATAHGVVFSWHLQIFPSVLPFWASRPKLRGWPMQPGPSSSPLVSDT